MKCPLCGKRKLAVCQDAILVFKLKTLEDGTVEQKAAPKLTNHLDNTWLECGNCHSTSEESKVLEEMFQDMVFA